MPCDDIISRVSLGTGGTSFAGTGGRGRGRGVLRGVDKCIVDDRWGTARLLYEYCDLGDLGDDVGDVTACLGGIVVVGGC